MTRINCVPPEELSTKHLVAEYRELPRIFGLARKAYERGERPTDKRNPLNYTLGTGHVRFFYNKQMFLQLRMIELVDEMRRRGHKPQFAPPTTLDLPSSWLNDWTPTPEAQAINRQRIKERTK